MKIPKSYALSKIVCAGFNRPWPSPLFWAFYITQKRHVSNPQYCLEQIPVWLRTAFRMIQSVTNGFDRCMRNIQRCWSRSHYFEHWRYGYTYTRKERCEIIIHSDIVSLKVQGSLWISHSQIRYYRVLARCTWICWRRPILHSPLLYDRQQMIAFPPSCCPTFLP